VDGWDTFAVIIGGAAGALVGLLFVAVSIRVTSIAASPELRNRAAQTLSLFVTVLLTAALLGILGQPVRILGIEVVLLAGVAATVLYLLDRRATSARSQQAIARVLDAISPNTTTCALLAAAGVVLICGYHAGLYVLVAPTIAALAGGIISAWLFLVRVTD
jgi:hypothetical protein